jgi:hypothetical protein
LLAAAEVAFGPPPVWVWTNSCVTLRGALEVVGLPAPNGADATAPQLGQIQISGVWLSGELRLKGAPACMQITDSTLVPGRSLTAQGEPAFAGEPSIRGSMVGGKLCLTRVISGPIALPESCSLRLSASILDAGSTYRPAFAGSDLASPGAELHIEDSTVIGRVWTQALRLASNTIFQAQLGRRDPWQAPVWAHRRQVGCVRFCWLPWSSLTPRRYRVPASRRRLAAILAAHFCHPAFRPAGLTAC